MTFVEIISDGSKKGIAVGLFHVSLILLAYSSPFWIDWRIIAVGTGTLLLEQVVFGNCVLNASQYGDSDGKFYENLLTHFHISYDRTRLRFWLTWIIPVIVLVAGFAVQHVGLHPVIKW